MARRRTLIAAGTVTALVAALGVAQLSPGVAPVARAEGLTPYDGCDDLLASYRTALSKAATPYGAGGFGGHGFFSEGLAASGGVARDAVAAAPAPAAAGAGAVGAVGKGATGTNLQEQGVDEPDIVKLADGRLVALAQSRLQVMSADADPRLLGSLPLGTAREPYVSGELLIVGDRALVVVQGYRQEPVSKQDASRSVYRPGTPTTRVILADLTGDRPRLLEEAVYDGQYVSARLTGGTVRLITTSTPNVSSTQPKIDYSGNGPSQSEIRAAERTSLAANRAAAQEATLFDVLPQVTRRNAGGTLLGTGNAVSCNQTTHAQEGTAGHSTLLVTTLRPEVGLGATDSDAVTTDGDLVYASTDRLYVATSRWGTTMAPVSPLPIDGGPTIQEDAAVSSGDTAVSSSDAPDSATPTATTSPSPTPSASAATDEVSTELHAFDVTGQTTRYVGSGSVPGYVLGRWALSEHEGALRVATTRQPPWNQAAPQSQQAQTSSSLVKLVERDGALVETGRVDGLGKTERIQAVRYFGNLAAVVTFRQTDPLYLVDLTGSPTVLGELKVPGFSTYLHPLGDGLLLGLGQEADAQGRVTGSQVSVFDISDPSTPRQVDRLQLGSGYSPAQEDSRAFGYDPARRLVTFAFSSYDARDYSQNSVGALGIAVSPTGQLSRVGLLEVSQTAPTQRVLSDDERVYAVSDSGVATGDPATMKRTGATDWAR